MPGTAAGSAHHQRSTVVARGKSGRKAVRSPGPRLVLTEAGQVVYRYAEEIFNLGNELTEVLKGRPRNRPLRLIVGVSDLIPKLIAYRILQPAVEMKGDPQKTCYASDVAFHISVRPPDAILAGPDMHRQIDSLEYP